MLYITKKVHFSASHRLFNPSFTNEKNDEIYDKCNNYYGHGHNYVLEVTVKGIPNPETGYVIDLKKLKRILNETIVDKVDHKHLNFDVDILKGVITSVENLAVIFWNLLKEEIKEAELYRIRLFETENSFVEYFGEPVEIKRF